MNNKPPKTDLNKLKDLYLNTNLTIKEICKELDVTFSTVKKWIKRLDLHRSEELQKQSFKKKYNVKKCIKQLSFLHDKRKGDFNVTSQGRNCEREYCEY